MRIEKRLRHRRAALAVRPLDLRLTLDSLDIPLEPFLRRDGQKLGGHVPQVGRALFRRERQASLEDGSLSCLMLIGGSRVAPYHRGRRMKMADELSRIEDGGPIFRVVFFQFVDIGAAPRELAGQKPKGKDAEAVDVPTPRLVAMESLGVLDLLRGA